MDVLAWLLLGAAVVGLVVLNERLKRASAEAAHLSDERAALQSQLAARDQRLGQLVRYEGIVDAEQHASQVVARAHEDARASLARGEADATRVRSDAHADRQHAAATLESAHTEAASIVRSAEQRATEIAADARAAIAQAEALEGSVQAMRNVIEGYGDRYLVPTFGLLDEFGEEFGFTEAGQRLKAARERTRRMIKERQAAKCDYVEATRRETAIHFVLDAFNGKVDSVLADVRHDNVGTLTQKVKDAYSLVNKNGEAFRNARIAQEYLDARLDELKWAVLVQELKLKEREEQRAIKERIREEERAQREFERAIKEAEKEESLLRTAMDKARREIERATDEQKAKYEQQLAQLAEKLRLAEEKNQRALSMAQQTRAGHVYVISNEGSFGEHIYKIGLTRRLEPIDRIRELGDASVPFDFDVHALIRSEDAPALERELHRRFVRQQVNKVNPRKEFFRVTVHEIRQVVEAMGCQAAWTMAAECRDYKETIAIERSLQSTTFAGNWEAQQIAEHDAALRDAVHAEAEAN
jgi:hypothetical protein